MLKNGAKWSAVFALCLLGAMIVRGQEAPARKWTLAEAIATAKRDHPLIVAARQRVAMAEAEQLEAGLRPNPSLYVSGENFPITGTRLPFDFGSSIDWFATYSHTFETANKRRLRASYAERNVTAMQAEAAAVERGILYEVKAAYHRVAIEKLRGSLLGEHLNNLNQLVGLNEVRVREGYTAEGDLIKVRLETQRVEYQLRRSALEYERARIELLRAMGAGSYEKSETGFDVAEELDHAPAMIDSALLREAAMTLPQVRARSAMVERAQAQLRLEQARTRPDFTFNVGYKRNSGDNTLVAGVTVPLPVYNRNQAQISRAEAELGAAEAEHRHARNLALAELAAAERAVRMNQQQIESLRADFLLRADESRSISLAAYREGAVDLLVLLDAQRVRAQAQEFYFQALYDYQLSIHELERASGIDRLPRQAPGARTTEPAPEQSPKPVGNGK
jgi:cobalt-zinc-cadmium efflux system outer membrane protein